MTAPTLEGLSNMTAEQGAIEAAVTKLVRHYLPKVVESVNVEPAENEDGDEYWLVTVKLLSPKIEDEALEQLLEDIEAEVAILDERYPSVRFLDAA
jgi:hypothetical protein